MIKQKILLQVSLVVLSLVPCLPAQAAQATADDSSPVVQVSRDESGRVHRRMIVNADGSRHVTATEYWPHGSVASRTVDEDVDRTGRPTARTVQQFDQRGRLLERRAASMDAAGRERGTRTLYTYGAQGRVSESTSPLER